MSRGCRGMFPRGSRPRKEAEMFQAQNFSIPGSRASGQLPAGAAQARGYPRQAGGVLSSMGVSPATSKADKPQVVFKPQRPGLQM